MPNLDELHKAIRHMAFEFNDRMAGLQDAVESNADKPPTYNSNDSQIRVLTNLKKCVQSAASVVSSASTSLVTDHPDQVSVTYGSDFGDVFPSEPGEAMLRWISSNTVYEFEEEHAGDLAVRGRKSSGKNVPSVEEVSGSEQSDSDNDLEVEIIQALLKRGKEKLSAKDYGGAEKLLRNCLTRTSSGSLVSLQRVPKSKSEIMTLLLETYLAQEKWDEAQSLLLEKIALGSRDTTSESGGIHADMLTLVDVLLHKSAYAEALLYGRRSLKGYRKLRSKGTAGVEKSLRALVRVCQLDGNLEDEQDAYSAILSDFLQKHPPNDVVAPLPSPTTVTSEDQLKEPRLTRSPSIGELPKTPNSPESVSDLNSKGSNVVHESTESYPQSHAPLSNSQQLANPPDGSAPGPSSPQITPHNPPSHEMEGKILRQIREERLLNGIDLENIDVSQENRTSEKIAEAFRKRQSEKAKQGGAAADATPSDGNRRLSISGKTKSSQSLRKRFVEPPADIIVPKTQDALPVLQRGGEPRKRAPRRLLANRTPKHLGSNDGIPADPSSVTQRESPDALSDDNVADNSPLVLRTNTDAYPSPDMEGKEVVPLEPGSKLVMKEELSGESGEARPWSHNDRTVELPANSGAISRHSDHTPRISNDNLSDDRDEYHAMQHMSTQVIMPDSSDMPKPLEVAKPLRQPPRRQLPRSLPPFRTYSESTILSSTDGHGMPPAESELPMAQRSNSGPTADVIVSDNQTDHLGLYQRVSQRISSMSLQPSASKNQDCIPAKEVIRRKLVIVGDVAVGKTTLLL
jgi:hypothetical protein